MIDPRIPISGQAPPERPVTYKGGGGWLVAGLAPQLLAQAGIKIDKTALLVLMIMLGFTRAEDEVPVCSAAQGRMSDRGRVTTRHIRTAQDRLEDVGLLRLIGTVGGIKGERKGRLVYEILLPRTDVASDRAIPDATSDRAIPDATSPDATSDEGADATSDEGSDATSDRSTKSSRSKRSDDDRDQALTRRASAGATDATPAPSGQTPRLSVRDKLIREAVDALGFTDEAAGTWVDERIAKATASPAAYVRRCIANEAAKAEESAPAKAGKAETAVKAAKAAKAKPAAGPVKCSRNGCRNLIDRRTAAGKAGLCIPCDANAYRADRAARKPVSEPVQSRPTADPRPAPPDAQRPVRPPYGASTVTPPRPWQPPQRPLGPDPFGVVPAPPAATAAPAAAVSDRIAVSYSWQQAVRGGKCPSCGSPAVVLVNGCGFYCETHSR